MQMLFSFCAIWWKKTNSIAVATETLFEFRFTDWTMIYLILIQLLLLNAEIVHGTASNSLSDCNTLAAKFSSTCTGGAAVASIIATTGVSVTCTSGFTALTCPGTYSNGICVFYHKLCVTCSGSSPVRIQVQSNGLPRFCPNAPAPISETPIDFTVNFNPDVSVNSPVANPQTAAALYAIACSTTSQSSVPPTSNFIQNVNSASLNVLAGVSIDGVSILNVNSANNVDPFYPTGGFSAESVDACLGHPNPSNIYHYHMASACALTQPSGSISSCSSLTSCSSSIASYAISAFSSYRTLTVIGIAKDGHIIYGPYYSSGVEVSEGTVVCWAAMTHPQIVDVFEILGERSTPFTQTSRCQ